MTEKRYTYHKSEITGLFVISDEKHRETFSGMEEEYDCMRIVRKLNTLTDENEQLKSRVEHFERKIKRERNATNIQHEKWEKEALEKITNLERENAKLNIEVEALKQIKPLQKLPQKITVVKLEDGDVE